MARKKLNASELRTKILEASDIKKEKMFIPEWDVEILVTAMSLQDRKRLRESAARSGKMVPGAGGEVSFADMDPEQLEVAILINNVKDLDGNPVFTKEDAAELMKKNSAITTRIASKVLELSGMTPELRREMATRFPTG